VAPHPEGHAFDQVGFLVPDAILTNSLYGIKNGKYVISVDAYPFHSVTLCPINQRAATVLFMYRGTQAIAVIFDNEYNREIPNRCNIQGFMKIALARATLTSKRNCNFTLPRFFPALTTAAFFLQSSSTGGDSYITSPVVPGNILYYRTAYMLRVLPV
jgi:hypothetical protein